MNKIADTLTKMVGPLPLGVWVAVVGAGIAIMVYQRKTTAGASDTGDIVYNDTSGVPGVGVGGSGQWVDLTPPTTENSTNRNPTTNDEWAFLALNRAIGDGMDPTQADYAIRQYLAGQAMDSQGLAIVNQLLRLLGAPPTSLGAPISKPPALVPPTTVKPPTTTVKPSFRLHTVKRGETISSIANTYRVSWNAVYQANRGGILRLDGQPGIIWNTANLAAGTILVIPTSTSNVYSSAPGKVVGYATHKVTAGETMASIAKRYNITWQALFNANAPGVRRADGSLGTLTNTANLKAGTILIIPKKG